MESVETKRGKTDASGSRPEVKPSGEKASTIRAGGVLSTGAAGAERISHEHVCDTAEALESTGQQHGLGAAAIRQKAGFAAGRTAVDEAANAEAEPPNGAATESTRLHSKSHAAQNRVRCPNG